MGSFEHYMNVNGRMLRLGYTTGTCAVLASKGAVYALLSGKAPDIISVMTPKGIRVDVESAECFIDGDAAVCAVRKDAGDDKDATDGILIYARVERQEKKDVVITGGEGIGLVTKPGLDQKVGEAAINSVPRREIREAVLSVMDELLYEGGMKITISAPGGEEIAKKTFNPKLGIEGGISIIGTSGIVEPMSLAAFSDAMRLQIRQETALGNRELIFVPGNYGLDHLCREGIDKSGRPVVVISNFIGDAIDEAVSCKATRLLIVGHAGKLVKCAAGIMNTHSSVADGRAEVFAAHAALCGSGEETVRRIFASLTSDECIEILKSEGMLEAVMTSIMKAIYERLSDRAGSKMKLGVIMFSNVYGTLGRIGDTDI